MRRSRNVAEAKPRRIRGAISPASIVARHAITLIVCIGTYSILCDCGADTSFYAYIGILGSFLLAYMAKWISGLQYFFEGIVFIVKRSRNATNNPENAKNRIS